MPNLPVSYHRVQRTPAGDDLVLVPGASAFTMSAADIANSAMVLIDVWPPSVHYWPRAEAVTTSIIAPCVTAARAKGMKIVHAPSGQPSHPSVLAPGDTTILTSDVIEHYAALNNLLAAWGTNRVFFAGHALNMCAIGRPVSLGFMILANKMRNHILISDAGASIEVSGSVGSPLGDAARVMASYFGERAYTCTSADLLASLA